MPRYPPIAIILLLCAAPAGAQLQLARIDGTVLGPTNEAQAGARVVLLDSLGAPVAETTTAADGHFSFPGIPFGTYVIRAGAPSMETVALPVTVERALPIHADVRLRPAVTDTVVVRGSIETASVTSRLALAADSLHGAPVRSRPLALQDVIATAPGWRSEDNGLLHVRGVDDGVLYVIDGVPVYERFDALSGIGPDAATLSSVNVMTGYIPPEFGLKSGAVIELRSRKGRPEWTGSLDAGYGSDTAWNGGGGIAHGDSSIRFIRTTSTTRGTPAAATRSSPGIPVRAISSAPRPVADVPRSRYPTATCRRLSARINGRSSHTPPSADRGSGHGRTRPCRTSPRSIVGRPARSTAARATSRSSPWRTDTTCGPASWQASPSSGALTCSRRAPRCRGWGSPSRSPSR
jgi:hypothetical protein